jgi:hypothetical protein
VAREVKSGQEEEEEDDFWATDKGVCGLGPGKRNSGRWPGLGRGTTHWVMTPDKEHWGRGEGGMGRRCTRARVRALARRRWLVPIDSSTREVVGRIGRESARWHRKAGAAPESTREESDEEREERNLGFGSYHIGMGKMEPLNYCKCIGYIFVG